MRNLISMFAFFVFFLSTTFASEKVIHVFLVGHGLVGKELLNQINRGFSSDHRIEVRVVGLANSQFMHFDPTGISLENWKERMTQSNEPMSIAVFINRMIELKLPHSVFVDCTSSQAIADIYSSILQSNISVVTPNKKANSGLLSTYFTLKTLAEQGHAMFLYDSNVGAGLPLIRTIRSINLSGDSITKLEAILSGTLSYLFNTFDGSVPFSQIVREAQNQGYTEPDPRDDLNGMDMARKFLILARESGLPLEMSDVVVQPFLPSDCFEATSISEFYEKLANFDENFTNLTKQARQNGEVLRFVGILENGKASLSLKTVKADHPFYHLSDTNNIATISTRYYSRSPIVIRGPGAGASVTAASVLSNIVEAGLENGS